MIILAVIKIFMLPLVGDWLCTQRKRKLMDRRSIGCCSLSHPHVSGCFWQTSCTKGDMLEFSMRLFIFFPTPTFAYYAMWVVAFLGENIQGRKPLRTSCVKIQSSWKGKNWEVCLLKVKTKSFPSIHDTSPMHFHLVGRGSVAVKTELKDLFIFIKSWADICSVSGDTLTMRIMAGWALWNWQGPPSL